jgi:hypothetical protein
MWHWLLNFFGVNNEAGYGYAFWSGIGSDFGEIALIGAIIAVYRKHNCHVKGCWRISRHPVDGTPWVVCRKHHPTIGNEAPTADQVVADHARAHAAKAAAAGNAS